MNDFVRFCYESNCKYNLAFNEYILPKNEWKWTNYYHYNYAVANDVLRLMRPKKIRLGSKYMIKDVMKYLVR